MKFTSALFCLCLALSLLSGIPISLEAADSSGTEVIKGYLLTQVNKMDAAAHDYATNAEAYQAIIDANGGDYNKAAINNGAEILSLIAKMQADYKGLHMNGYETVEGNSFGLPDYSPGVGSQIEDSKSIVAVF